MTTSSQRLVHLDRYRGLAIFLMVFYALGYRLSRGVPEFLRHNDPARFHVGDLVLPMFLFSSGLALGSSLRKRGTVSLPRLYSSYRKKILKQVAIGAFFSPLSAFRFLGMDEVMLNALLTVPGIAVGRGAWPLLVASGIFPAGLYLVLLEAGRLPDFGGAYLGGYTGAGFYFPVLIGGLTAGRYPAAIPLVSALSLVLFAATSVVVPPIKLSVTPSFMFLSLAWCAALLPVVQGVRSRPLERIGREPLLYWGAMFAFLAVLTTRRAQAIFSFHWVTGHGAAVAYLAAVYCYTVLRDRARPRGSAGRPAG